MSVVSSITQIWDLHTLTLYIQTSSTQGYQFVFQCEHFCYRKLISELCQSLSTAFYEDPGTGRLPLCRSCGRRCQSSSEPSSTTSPTRPSLIGKPASVASPTRQILIGKQRFLFWFKTFGTYLVNLIVCIL